MNTFDYCLKNDSKGVSKCYIRQEKEDFSHGSQVLILSSGKRQEHIFGEHNCYVSCKCIIRKTMVFTYKVQHGFACLKKHLYLPAFSINSADFIFRKIRICADERNPILTVFLVADTDDFSRNCIIFKRVLSRLS